MAAGPEFLALNEKSKQVIDNFENALFQDLSLKSQNKQTKADLNDPKTLNAYRKKVIADTKKKMSELNPLSQAVYLNAINKAFMRFALFLGMQPSLFAGLPLSFDASRQASRREHYLRHQEIKKREEIEEFEKEWDEYFEAEDKLEEEFLELEKKLTKEEEEKLAQERQHHHGPHFREKVATGALAVSTNPKVVADTLTQNLATLNQILHQSLKDVVPSFTKMDGIALEPDAQQLKTLNQNIANLENNLRIPNPTPEDRQNMNNQFNQVIDGYRQQYQNLQANIPADNIAGQSVLNQWKLQVEQNLSQWMMKANVQQYDEAYKNKLQQDWNTIANKPVPSSTLHRPEPAEQAQAAAPKNKSGSTPSPLAHTFNHRLAAGIAASTLASSATAPGPAAGPAAALKNEQEDPEQKKKNAGPVSWPPKPDIPGSTKQ